MIVRIYTGPDGQTHFEDLPLPAEESHNFALQAGANLVFRCFPAHYFSDWHIAPRRQYIFLITDYPQPFAYGTKQEHMAVSAGLNDGAQQGAVSKGPQ